MNQEKIRTIKSTFAIVLCTIFTLFLAGCSESSTDPGNNNGPGNGDPGANEVSMVGHSFNPATIEVEVGTTVRWTNTTSEVHTVTSGTGGQHDGIFDSGNISPGGEFTYQFNETGTFDYYCIPHVGAGMVGSVTVVEESSGTGDNDSNGDDDGGNGNGYGDGSG